MLSSSGQFFSASFHVFEMLIFEKLMKDDFSDILVCLTSFLLFLLCVQSIKSCREGSILTEPHPLLNLYFPETVMHPIKITRQA